MCYTDNLYSAKWDRKKTTKENRKNECMNESWIFKTMLFVCFMIFFFDIFYGLNINKK